MQLLTLHKKITDDALAMREDVESVLTPMSQQRYRGPSMYITPFLSRLNEVTIPFKVHNELVEDISVDPTGLELTAQWSPTWLQTRPRRRIDIHIEWHVHPRGRRCGVQTKDWQRRHFYFWAYLMHELAHRHQNIHRPDDALSQKFIPTADDDDLWDLQKYLGDFDEVEAYAHDIALEMVVWFPTLGYRAALAQIKKFRHNLVNGTYPLFALAFVKAPKHPAMVLLFKKIQEWYRIMDTQRDIYQALQLGPL